jgi:hypothetical protein
MKHYIIPNLKEILKPRWAHKPGFGMSEEYVLHKRESFEQSSTPKDSNLLKKLGMKKNDKVLAIASYYASWASQLAKAGVKVDYSDISKEMVGWAKKEYKKLFGKYLCSNYELIPQRENQYDWTFTYEACGGGSGLPLAYLRSLINNKGGILVLLVDDENPKRMGGKLKRYPGIVKTLSEIYGAKFSIKNIKIRGHRIKKDFKLLPYLVCRVLTNPSAREMAKSDLEALTSNHFTEENLKRLTKLSKIIGDKFKNEKTRD